MQLRQSEPVFRLTQSNRGFLDDLVNPTCKLGCFSWTDWSAFHRHTWRKVPVYVAHQRTFRASPWDYGRAIFVAALQSAFLAGQDKAALACRLCRAAVTLPAFHVQNLLNILESHVALFALVRGRLVLVSSEIS